MLLPLLLSPSTATTLSILSPFHPHPSPSSGSESDSESESEAEVPVKRVTRGRVSRKEVKKEVKEKAKVEVKEAPKVPLRKVDEVRPNAMCKNCQGHINHNKFGQVGDKDGVVMLMMMIISIQLT